MTIQFNAKGSFTLNKDVLHSVIYGEIIEGKIEKGMHVLVSLSGAATVEFEIENIEYIDIISEKKSYLGLILKAEDDPEFETEFVESLGIKEEILEIK